MAKQQLRPTKTGGAALPRSRDQSLSSARQETRPTGFILRWRMNGIRVFTDRLGFEMVDPADATVFRDRAACGAAIRKHRIALAGLNPSPL